MANWRNEFYTFMNSKNWNSDNMKELIKNNQPKSLYKYKEVSENTLKMIKEGNIWASNPKEFNDPYDCLLDFDCEIMIKKRLNISENIHINEKAKNKLYNNIKSYIDNIINEIAIVCLSEEKDNILMWSHYAKNHQGICIEYDYNDIRDYTEVYPVVYMDENIDLSESIIDIDPHGIQRKIMMKFAAWEYEKEWRIIFSNSNPKTNGGLIHFPKIKSIYLGCKITKDDKEKIIELAKEKKIGVYQMKMERNKFKLIYDKI
ncbi:DUF2971 domain-containing protein [Clostridium perfringens]|uniref:DUF2971 domain-containing protein n=1 Tax=Clostridium perfringens TaxID=1502 RepID=UPI000F537E83|nr:DUF2971 domain-containing protein [Clostridium perfringens]MDK3222626.1 DUF2971 domain-containing protein [Clostridium perfringens]MDV5090084.1 DUF2971 domain-containing protein [Clostridium perfringens]MDV5108134.1 DUF2971 domain-containing protein [Clostridium perfringens]MDZ5014795.1 DUF2971 domain-containing protein [Clostridium perfringens]RQN17382.1 DUF2971 domain-containing protein [Clostridium perfringens]